MAAVTQPPEWSNNSRASYRARDDWSLKWWMMFAIILSIVFHMALYVSFDALGLAGTDQKPLPKLPERVRISEKLLKDQQAIQQNYPDRASAIGIVLVIGVLILAWVSRHVTERD